MKTFEQVVAEEKAAYEAYERATIHQGFTVAELREAMGRVQNPENWKNPWRATVKVEDVRKVVIAVEFFHGDRPRGGFIDEKNGTIEMYGSGYQG